MSQVQKNFDPQIQIVQQTVQERPNNKLYQALGGGYGKLAFFRTFSPKFDQNFLL